MIRNAFRGTLMLPGLVLIFILAFLVLFNGDDALGYTGASVYTLLTVVTMARKWKEIDTVSK